MKTTSLEQRLQALEDIEAIKQLKARYLFGCDTRDVELMRNCFATGEVLIDFGFIGQFTDVEAFLKVFVELACHPTQFDMHHGVAPEIELTDADTARGRWRLQFQLLEAEKNVVQLMSSYYEDEYVREATGWRIRRSRSTIMSNLFLAADAGVLKISQIGSGDGLASGKA